MNLIGYFRKGHPNDLSYEYYTHPMRYYDSFSKAYDIEIEHNRSRVPEAIQ